MNKLKKIWWKITKNRRKNKRLKKDINDIREVINTSALTLGEEGTKNIAYLKRQMFLMEEENINLFNEEKKNQRRLKKNYPK